MIQFFSFQNKHLKIEKKLYLVAVVISVILTIKIFLVLFFVHSLDALSSLIPGAMCGAGVISANSYGMPLLILKLSILMIGSVWLLLNRLDMLHINSIYLKKKLSLFIVLFILIGVELSLSIAFYMNLPTQTPVLCCSSIYLNDSNPIPFNLTKESVALLFFILYIALMITLYKRYRYISAILSIIFVYISYYAIVYFFGIYIYELPSHKCPFCMLQKDYYYVGYFIYTSLFIAIFYTLAASFFPFIKNVHNKTMIFYTIFVLILMSSFLIYFIKNSTFL